MNHNFDAQRDSRSTHSGSDAPQQVELPVPAQFEDDGDFDALLDDRINRIIREDAYMPAGLSSRVFEASVAHLAPPAALPFEQPRKIAIAGRFAMAASLVIICGLALRMATLGGGITHPGPVEDNGGPTLVVVSLPTEQDWELLATPDDGYAELADLVAAADLFEDDLHRDGLTTDLVDMLNVLEHEATSVDQDH